MGGVSDRPRLLLATSDCLSGVMRELGEGEGASRQGTNRQVDEEGGRIVIDVEAIRATLLAELRPLVDREDAAYRLHLATTLLARALTALSSSLDLPLAKPLPGPLT